MKNLVIIKLGGSIITDKASQKKVFRKAVVQRLAQEIKAVRNKKKFNLILIHGAGSFAHPLAKRYRLHEGYLNTESSKGFAETKIGVLELNLRVWQELERAGIKACIVEAGAVIKAESSRIKEFDTKFIEFLLSQDITPLLSGDVVIDQKMGFSIISGDQIAAFLAKTLGANKVIFVSDVDGVFDKDPQIAKDARVINEINTLNYQDILKKIRVRNKGDVTGEMKGKILSIKEHLSGIKVLIVNGQKPSNMLKSLVNDSKQGFGTVINF